MLRLFAVDEFTPGRVTLAVGNDRGVLEHVVVDEAAGRTLRRLLDKFGGEGEAGGGGDAHDRVPRHAG